MSASQMRVASRSRANAAARIALSSGGRATAAPHAARPQAAPVQCPAGLLQALPARPSRRRTAVVQAATVSTRTVTTYRFTVPKYTAKFGQTLRVVGSTRELGNWNPDKALPLVWCEGDTWSLDQDLYYEEFEFKLLVGEGNRVVRWEEGPNRVVKAGKFAGKGQPLELTCDWAMTGETPLSIASSTPRVPRAASATVIKPPPGGLFAAVAKAVQPPTKPGPALGASAPKSAAAPAAPPKVAPSSAASGASRQRPSNGLLEEEEPSTSVYSTAAGALALAVVSAAGLVVAVRLHYVNLPVVQQLIDTYLDKYLPF